MYLEYFVVVNFIEPFMSKLLLIWFNQKGILHLISPFCSNRGVFSGLLIFNICIY